MKKKSAVIKALEQFLDGPKIIGSVRNNDWDLPHPKTMVCRSPDKRYDGKTIEVVWLSSRTADKLDLEGFLESPDGLALRVITEKGLEALKT